jgi:hypothetical protein
MTSIVALLIATICLFTRLVSAIEIDADAPTELCWNATSRAACAVQWLAADKFIAANATGTFALNVDNSTRSLVIRSLLRFNASSHLTSVASVVPEICVVLGKQTVDWAACAWSNLGLVLSVQGSDVFAQSNVVVELPPSDNATSLLIGVRLPAAVKMTVDAATMLSIVARPILDAKVAFDGSVWQLAFGDVILAQVHNTKANDRQYFNVELCSSPKIDYGFLFANLIQFATSPALKPGDAFATRSSGLMLHADVHSETSICSAPCKALMSAPDNGVPALLAVALDALQSDVVDPGALAVRLSSAVEGNAPSPFGYQGEFGSLQVVRSGDDLLVARPLADGVESASLYIACSDNETLPVFNNQAFYSSMCWLDGHLKPVAVVPRGEIDVPRGRFLHALRTTHGRGRARRAKPDAVQFHLQLQGRAIGRI